MYFFISVDKVIHNYLMNNLYLNYHEPLHLPFRVHAEAAPKGQVTTCGSVKVYIFFKPFSGAVNVLKINLKKLTNFA